jgi:hypothetical protein
MYSLALIIFVVSEEAFEHFPIGSNVNLCPVAAATFGPGELKTTRMLAGSLLSSTCSGSMT